jgi:hypothetical protein
MGESEDSDEPMRKIGVGLPSSSAGVPGSGQEGVRTRDVQGALAYMIEGWDSGKHDDWLG